MDGASAEQIGKILQAQTDETIMGAVLMIERVRDPSILTAAPNMRAATCFAADLSANKSCGWDTESLSEVSFLNSAAYLSSQNR